MEVVLATAAVLAIIYVVLMPSRQGAQDAEPFRVAFGLVEGSVNVGGGIVF